MPRGANVKRHWEQVKKQAGIEDRGTWDVMNNTKVVILRNSIKINGVSYSGKVRVSPGLAEDLRYMDDQVERARKEGRRI